MKVKGEKCKLRGYKESDIDRIVEIGNNKKIAINLTHMFPHPAIHISVRPLSISWLQRE